MVVGEDLVDAKSNIGELQALAENVVAGGQTHQKRRFDRVAPSTDDTPSAEENSGCDSDTDQDGVDVADLGKGSDAPEEVNGGRDDGRGGDEKADLKMSVYCSKHR